MADGIDGIPWLLDLMNATIPHQPALAAVDTTPENVRSCVVCMQDKPTEVFPVTDCSRHYHDPDVCETCFRKHIAGHISAGNTIIQCVECSERLHYKDIQKIVSKTSLRKYDKILTKAFVEDEADFHYCVSTSGLRETTMKKRHVSHFKSALLIIACLQLSAKCKSGQIHVGGGDQPVFQCNACHHKQCIACHVPWHEGETCDEYQSRHDEVIVKTETLLHQTSKVCPGGCGARIERNGGCPHMTCEFSSTICTQVCHHLVWQLTRGSTGTRCSAEFCYHCLRAWTNHDSHNGCATSAATAAPVPISADIRHRQAMRLTRQILHDLENQQAEAYILKTFTSCPRCRVFIDKAGGCDHVTCSQCSYEFCYGCSADYQAILRDDNSRHKRSCKHYAARVSDRVVPTKMTGVHSSTVVSVASVTKPRVASKRTTKKKPSSIGKKKSAVAKKKATQAKKKIVASPVVRRGTRTGLRSSTAAVRGPVTRSQTAAQRMT